MSYRSTLPTKPHIVYPFVLARKRQPPRRPYTWGRDDFRLDLKSTLYFPNQDPNFVALYIYAGVSSEYTYDRFHVPHLYWSTALC